MTDGDEINRRDFIVTTATIAGSASALAGPTLTTAQAQTSPPPGFDAQEPFATLDAIFGMSGRVNMRKKRSFASNTTMPFGSVPYDWTLLPSGSTCSHEASVHVPIS